MRGPRGFLLLYGLVMLAVMLAAAMLLAHAANARRQTQRSASQRSTAIAHAETALEQARTALAAGTLSPGNSTTLDGCSVVCTKINDAVQLDTLAPLEIGNMKSTASHPREAVRVRWTLTAIEGKQWNVSEWHVQNETLR